MTIAFDPFAPDSKEYSAEKFYTKGYDSQGHTHPTRYGPKQDDRVNVLRHVVAAIDEAVMTIPQYRSRQDFFRDAAIHCLKMRAEQMKGTLPPEWVAEVEQIVGIAELEREEAKRNRHEVALDKIESLLRESRSDEQRYEAIAICERVAMTLEYADCIRRASDLIDRYRR